MAELELKEVSYFYESGGKRIDILDKASYSFEKGQAHHRSARIRRRRNSRFGRHGARSDLCLRRLHADSDRQRLL